MERVVIAPAWQERLQLQQLDTVAAVYDSNRGEAILQSSSSQVRHFRLDDTDLYLKKYWIQKPSQLWSMLFRGALFGTSKARREFNNLQRFRDWDLAAPEAVAYGEERRAGWLIRSYLITVGVAQPHGLDAYIRDQLPRQPARRRELIDRLADATRHLHRHRFCHGDYFWRNIILSGDDLTRFFLIDAHRGKFWRGASGERYRAHDLACLDAPAAAYFRRSERLRFFLQYRNHRRLDAADKRLLRQVLCRAEPMRPRQLRRVREVMT